LQFNFGTLINSILVAIIIFYVYFYPKIKAAKGQDRRKTVAINPATVKPGDGETCKENRDKIIGLEKSVENIEDDIKEMKKNNREDHDKIFDKIDKIRNKRR